MRTANVLGAIAAGFVLLLTASVDAQPTTGFVTFTIDKTVTDIEGTWTATGDIQDHGTCCIEPPHYPRGFSGVVRTIDDLTGQSGTITLRADTMFNGRALGNHVVALSGAWHILGGSGAYAGASGQGSISGTFNQATDEMHAVNYGTISLAPDAGTYSSSKQ